jgi:hypothetical protein
MKREYEYMVQALWKRLAIQTMEEQDKSSVELQALKKKFDLLQKKHDMLVVDHAKCIPASTNARDPLPTSRKRKRGGKNNVAATTAVTTTNLPPTTAPITVPPTSLPPPSSSLNPLPSTNRPTATTTHTTQLTVKKNPVRASAVIPFAAAGAFGTLDAIIVMGIEAMVSQNPAAMQRWIDLASGRDLPRFTL